MTVRRCIVRVGLAGQSLLPGLGLLAGQDVFGMPSQARRDLRVERAARALADDLRRAVRAGFA